MASFRGEVEPPRAALNRCGPPERRFDENFSRVKRDGRSVATHDAGQRFDCMRAADDAHGFVDFNSLTIEQFDLLTVFAPAHMQLPAGNFGRIKNVRGAAQLQHDVVGNVDQG